jgi:hypothetical protein
MQAGGCNVFIYHVDGFLVVNVNPSSTPRMLKNIIYSRLGVNPSVQRLYSGRCQLDDRCSLENQLDMTVASPGPNIYLSCCLLGGGDRNIDGSQHLVKSKMCDSDVGLDSELKELLQTQFPRHYPEYAAMLVDHDLVTCESLGEMSVDDLIDVGFKKAIAKRLLNHCCCISIALSIDHASQVVGHFRSPPLACLSRVRETIENAKLPGIPLNFSFTYHNCPLTLKQESSWSLKQIVTDSDKIVITAIENTQAPPSPNARHSEMMETTSGSCFNNQSMQSRGTLAKGLDCYTSGTSKYLVQNETAKPLETTAGKEIANAGEQDHKEDDLQSPKDIMQPPLEEETFDLTVQSSQESIANPVIPGTEIEQDESGGGESKSVEEIKDKNINSQPSDSSDTGKSVAVNCDLISKPPSSPAVASITSYEQTKSTMSDRAENSFHKTAVAMNSGHLIMEEQRHTDQYVTADHAYPAHSETMKGDSVVEDISLVPCELVNAVQRSLLGLGVDALLDYTNPYQDRTDKVIGLSSFFVKTRRAKDKIMVFCSLHNREENKIIVKNLRVFLKDCLKLPGCGALTLIKDSETYSKFGPFEVVQNDSHVKVMTEQLLIEDYSDGVIKFEVVQSKPSIFSSKLSRWLKRINSIPFCISEDLNISLPTMELSGIVDDSDVLSMQKKPNRGKTKEEMAQKGGKLELKASFKQFEQCSLQQASHFYFGQDLSPQGIYVSNQKMEALHKSLQAYHRKRIPYNVHQMMTEKRTLLVLKFHNFDPTKHGILCAVQASLQQHDVVELEKQQCVICQFGSDDFHIYWPHIELDCSYGHLIRDSILASLEVSQSDQSLQWEDILVNPYSTQSLPVVGSTVRHTEDFSVLGMFSREGKLIRNPEDLLSDFKLLLDLTNLRRDASANDLRCMRDQLRRKPLNDSEGEASGIGQDGECRPWSRPGRLWKYDRKSILPAEGRDREYKSLNRCQKIKLPFKIIQHAVRFVVGCLNARIHGVIAFGVGDQQEQEGRFQHGEVVGLDIVGLEDNITKLFQYMLDHMIRSDEHHNQRLPLSEQQCISLHFIDVVPRQERRLHVVEVEVDPDSTVCKGNVYIAKAFEKKTSDKCLKEVPDNWHYSADYSLSNDFTPYVREMKGTTKMYWPDFMKHKAAVEAGYKQKTVAVSRDLPKEEDLSQLSGKLQRVLHDLDFERYQYILICNAIPGEHRENSQLDFLAEIPWTAVIDFDSSSENGGLYSLMKQKLDSEGKGSDSTRGVFSRQVNILDVTDFKDQSPALNKDKTFGSSCRTSWIFANGRQGVTPMQESYSDWVANCERPAEDALCSYLHLQKTPVSVFLLVSKSSLQEIACLLHFAFSVLGPKRSGKEIAVICQENKIVQDLRELVRIDVGECCVAGLPWSHVKENVRQMLSGREVITSISEKHVISSTGTAIPIPVQRLRTWENIDVVGYYECETEHPQEVIEKSRDMFYKGHQPEWLNFFLHHEIDRSDLRRVQEEIQQWLDSLKSPNFGQERDHKSHIRTVVVHHYPGTGGTTFCRRILWVFRKKYRCALIKAITEDTASQIRSLYEFAESVSNTFLPLLLLVDSVDEHAFRVFCSTLDKSRVKSVILQCRPILGEPQEKRKIHYEDSGFKLARQLSKAEVTQITNLISVLESDCDKRTQLIRSVKSNRQILYFGLQLFGQEYNQKLLGKYVVFHLDNVSKLEVEMLTFCSLVYTYMHLGIPRACVQSLLSPLEGPFRISMADISETTADLIVLNTEGYEKYVYDGYRPAHHLIGTEVLHRFPLLDTATQFLEKMIGSQVEYAAGILTDIALRLFTRRDAKYDLDEETVDGDVDIVTENTSEHAGRVQERRFSPLITTIMKDSKYDALKLLLILCEKTLQSPANAFVWQHLARYLAYEVGEMDLPREYARFLSYLLSGESYWSRNDFDDGNMETTCAEPVEKYTGYEAAVKAINRAIDQKMERSIFHTTRGLVYKLQLSPYKTRSCEVEQLPEIIRTAQLSFDAFEMAKSCPMSYINWYPMIGEIEVCLDLLAIVKDSEVFRDYVTPADRKSVFRAFMEGMDIPKEMKRLHPDQITFIQEREECIRSTLDNIFECEYLTRGWDRERRYEYQSAQARGARLRRKFVEVSECQHTIKLAKKEKMEAATPELRRQMVEEMLYTQGEDPYSAWVNFRDGDLAEIVRWLKPCCNPEKGRLNTDTDTTVMMLVRACVERRGVGVGGGGATNIATNELLLIVNSWCNSKPKSAWAHLFQYMLYFPLPNSICPPDKDIVRHAINCCQTTIRNKQYVPRKSRPRYFVGRGEGLDMIISAAQISVDYYENTTNFWRSKRVMSTLTRLKGTKHKFGLIMYQGIEVSFDNELYPKESKDWLWFYLGFTIQGPYAYDPIDPEKFDELRKVDLSTLPDIPLCSSPEPQRSFRTRNGERRHSGDRFCRPETPPRFRAQKAGLTENQPLAEDITASHGEHPAYSPTTVQSVSDPMRPDGEVTEPIISKARQVVSPTFHGQQVQEASSHQSGSSKMQRAESKSRHDLGKSSSKTAIETKAELNPICPKACEQLTTTLSDTEVFVSKLKPSTSKKQLETAFARYGTVVRVNQQPRNTAYVTFSDPAAATAVVESESVTVRKHKVKVRRAGLKIAKVKSDSVLSSSSCNSPEKSIATGKRLNPRENVKTSEVQGDRQADIRQPDKRRISLQLPGLAGAEARSNRSAILIQNLDSTIQNESILELCKVFEDSVLLHRLSQVSAVAFYRDLATADLAQRKLNDHMLKQTNRLEVALLPPEAVNQMTDSLGVEREAAGQRLEESSDKEEFDCLRQQELIIFQTQLLETLDAIRLDYCAMEAEQISRVVETIDFLQTCVESIVDKGPQKPKEMTALCRKLKDKKLSVSVPGSEVQFTQVLKDYCNRKFQDELTNGQVLTSMVHYR